jgi:hypothetical protein
MKDNKNQHFVPQYYLKNFSVNENINIYDLKEKKSFTNSIKSTAYKKFFYNVDVDFFNKIIVDEKYEESDFIDKIINKHNESILATFFDSFNKTRERIINNDNRKTISVIDFHSLVDFILVQTYRNPKFSLYFKQVDELIKSKYKDDNEKEYDKITRGIVILLLFNEVHKGKKTIFKKDILISFNEIIAEIKIMKQLITDSYKIVYWNKTSVDFLTSDSALSFMRLNPSDIFTTIFVPINTKVGVVLVNKESPIFDKNIKKNCTIIQLEEDDIEQIEIYNQTIIEKANRFVYSIDGKFPKNIKNIEYKYWWNLD